MGQRLVIVNYYEDYPRNSIYFHWSGYTDRAIFELKEFTNYIQENLDKIKDVESFQDYCKRYDSIKDCVVHTYGTLSCVKMLTIGWKTIRMKFTAPTILTYNLLSSKILIGVNPKYRRYGTIKTNI